MHDFINQLNALCAESIGITFFHADRLFSTLILMVINFTTIGIIARQFYLPRAKQRVYVTVLITMAACIFMLVSLMNNASELQMGAALGLFAIFSIIRFRTEAIPVREMTYLFMFISISVVNAMGGATYHRKMEYWEGLGLATVLLMNIIFVFIAWFTERQFFGKELCSKYIKYDNVNLIAPEKRQELIADIENRTGLKIIRIEVGMVDFLKDSCLIRIFYDEPMDQGSSIAHMARPPRG